MPPPPFCGAAPTGATGGARPARRRRPPPPPRSPRRQRQPARAERRRHALAQRGHQRRQARARDDDDIGQRREQRRVLARGVGDGKRLGRGGGVAGGGGWRAGVWAGWSGAGAGLGADAWRARSACVRARRRGADWGRAARRTSLNAGSTASSAPPPSRHAAAMNTCGRLRKHAGPAAAPAAAAPPPPAGASAPRPPPTAVRSVTAWPAAASAAASAAAGGCAPGGGGADVERSARARRRASAASWSVAGAGGGGAGGRGGGGAGPATASWRQQPRPGSAGWGPHGPPTSGGPGREAPPPAHLRGVVGLRRDEPRDARGGDVGLRDRDGRPLEERGDRRAARAAGRAPRQRGAAAAARHARIRLQVVEHEGRREPAAQRRAAAQDFDHLGWPCANDLSCATPLDLMRERARINFWRRSNAGGTGGSGRTVWRAADQPASPGTCPGTREMPGAHPPSRLQARSGAHCRAPRATIVAGRGRAAAASLAPPACAWRKAGARAHGTHPRPRQPLLNNTPKDDGGP